MNYLTFNHEKAFERLSELEEFISIFPESPLCEIMKTEIEEIEKML